MKDLAKALWFYKPVLVSRLLNRRKAVHQWNWLEHECKVEIPKEWLPRWSSYLIMIELVEHWSQKLGATQYKTSNLAAYLAAFIALYDDYTDDFDLKHLSIMQLLKAKPMDDRQRLFTYLYQKIEQEHPNFSFFSELLALGGKAQDLSLLQKKKDTSQDLLWQITHAKGGYFTLICYSAFFESLDQEQQSYIYDFGANIQLLNDTFDVYKDIQGGIYTLPNSVESIKTFSAFYEERMQSWFNASVPFTASPKVKKETLTQIALPFAAGVICVNQYAALEDKYGSFSPHERTRKELICDMDSFSKVIESMRVARVILKS